MLLFKRMLCLLAVPVLAWGGVGAASPAQPLPGTVPALTLRWSVPEPVLRGSQITRPLLHRSVALRLTPVQWAAVRQGQSLGALKEALDAVYRQIETRRPRDLRFVRQATGWTGQAQTGWQVDRPATEAALLSALRSGRTVSTLSVRLLAPARSVRWAQEQGIGPLATGRSLFSGSPEFRIHNIRVGASRLQGQWVGVGQSFSFNALIGPVTAARGFQPGYVVTGQTLSLEEGGGICQVSTTVFRAALQAGLPITERHAHSYQVGYYGDPGLDAAVYAPSKDLRWRNDTRSAVLVQVAWDLTRQELSVHLFGRADGRRVTLATSRLGELRPPPEPTFRADPTLEPGTAQRIDMPAPGTVVQLTRQITRADGTVRREVWTSRYRAWGGVFAVAPGDERLN